jgi:ketosteroid isomerase-like protein
LGENTEEIMKIRLLLTLVGLAIGFALPAFAQQKDTAESRIAQQRDLIGDAKALDEFGELGQKLDAAFSEKDAAALASLFTEDGLLVAPDGMFSGRQAIEKRYRDTFLRSPFTSFGGPSHYLLKAIDNAVWSVGEWSSTLQSKTGLVFVRGYWSAIYVREGDAWKIRLLTLIERPRPV